MKIIKFYKNRTLNCSSEKNILIDKQVSWLGKEENQELFKDFMSTIIPGTIVSATMEDITATDQKYFPVMVRNLWHYEIEHYSTY